jgi:hypothetical protein
MLQQLGDHIAKARQLNRQTARLTCFKWNFGRVVLILLQMIKVSATSCKSDIDSGG